jgi:hypothetical protein
MRTLLFIALVGLSGCELITQFDEESQQCDLRAPVGQQCSAGFQCIDSVCKRAAADGGTRADAGP